MRFTPALLVLAAIATAVADNCAICPEALPPAFAHVSWKLVWNSQFVANDTMFCGYRGKEKGLARPLYTFCTYTNEGVFIENYLSLRACPQTAKVGECHVPP
ncbi:hypothetical protein B0H17DRAFT_1193644 [Mycena rosella]|uniref:Secreted protein n=1 Tax=Mycena rosella TaxID=1033263 RepID=A0AAD7GSP3_MYCRO|nr:hypothetical protein B0H17DRAFT_1193644 [Mycena rosella]